MPSSEGTEVAWILVFCSQSAFGLLGRNRLMVAVRRMPPVNRRLPMLTIKAPILPITGHYLDGIFALCLSVMR
jgi:hypothetical protein